MNNDKGIILVIVLAVSLMVMILGATAIKMSEIGYLAYGSEKRYQVANAAAETGINAGLKYVVDNSACPASTSSTLSTGGVNASYTYFSITGGSSCFIHAKGSYGNATVVKTAIVPAASSGNWGALVVRSGTVALGGSGAIINCDTDCSNGGPAIIYKDATTITGTAPSTKLPSACANNEKGPVGSPATSQNSLLPDDLTSTYFDSTDITDLESDLRTKYGVDTTSIAALSSSCKYTGTSACDTTSATNIRCGLTDINLTTCPKVYIQQANLTIDQSLSSKTIYSGAKVIVSGGTTNTNVFANTIYLDVQSANISGGTFFSNSTSSTSSPATNSVYVKSNKQLGSSTDPILFISKGYTKFDSNGGPDIYGLIFTNSNSIDVNGNIKFRGSFIDSNTATMTFSGNAEIQFDKSVLETLKTNLGTIGTALKSPTCGVSQSTSSSITKTKIAVY
ncbi:MAG: hypothetical protein C0392_00500 [Syntrophus sp. (in: bacteria)]|nr:hypothetical protein [Syntrophus sp. (in: bacteria)]